MPAKKGNYRGRGTFCHAGSSDREASLDSVRRSMLASPDDERSLTEHEDNAEEVEEQNFSSPQLEERQMNRMTADFIEAPSTPFSNDRETAHTALRLSTCVEKARCPIAHSGHCVEKTFVNDCFALRRILLIDQVNSTRVDCDYPCSLG
uniref:Uncharacterized protein n=1 Tax=Hanusia phi TaxID=3032 RepID=A0A7S0EC89_9CRYP